jgi:hypothetical protein
MTKDRGAAATPIRARCPVTAAEMTAALGGLISAEQEANALVGEVLRALVPKMPPGASVADIIAALPGPEGEAFRQLHLEVSCLAVTAPGA